MSYEAKVLADSITTDRPHGVRLTTLEVTFPRIVLAEFNTHRMLSRNSASSRAIPVEKRIAAVRENPFVPEAFGANKKGMQAGEELADHDQITAEQEWLRACTVMIEQAGRLAEIGVHKQWANRLLEPFGWHTLIVTATEWSNFFALRCNPDAQPEIRRAAELMRDAMAESTPIVRGAGQWHLPLVFQDDLDCADMGEVADLVKLSVARCARVSYLTHEGKRDVDADLTLYDRLLKSGHMSPFEHAAMVDVTEGYEFHGNFRAPWLQHRKMIDGEDVFQPKT